jgi:hypothetical protein
MIGDGFFAECARHRVQCSALVRRPEDLGLKVTV